MVLGLRRWRDIGVLGLAVGLCLCGCARVAPPPHLDVAKQAVVRYYEGGECERETRQALEPAFRAIAAMPPDAMAKAAIVLDIDETALSTYEYQKGMDFGHYGPAWHEWLRLRRATAIAPVLELYRAARAKGLEVFFVTGRRESFRADTEANLKAAGYEGWTELMMKPDAFRERSVAPFKTRCREQIEAKGYRIVLNIGDQDSDLDGGHAEMTVRLPNTIYRSP